MTHELLNNDQQKSQQKSQQKREIFKGNTRWYKVTLILTVDKLSIIATYKDDGKKWKADIEDQAGPTNELWRPHIMFVLLKNWLNNELPPLYDVKIISSSSMI